MNVWLAIGMGGCEWNDVIALVSEGCVDEAPTLLLAAKEDAL